MPSMTVDPAEVAQFDALSTEWWDPKGPFAPLHRFTPVRMDYFRSRLTRHFGLPRDGARPLAGLRVLDIGCGGGLIAEPLHRLGAAVTAIDAAAALLGVVLPLLELEGRERQGPVAQQPRQPTAVPVQRLVPRLQQQPLLWVHRARLCW